MRLIIFALLVLCSCGPTYHLKQAEKHLKKAEIKGATVTVDTVYITKEVIVPETRFDTVLSVRNFRDTITLTKDNIVTRIKFDTITRSVFVQTICPPDTLRIKVPFSVTKEIKSGWPWWWLIVAFLIGAVLTIAIKKGR